MSVIFMGHGQGMCKRAPFQQGWPSMPSAPGGHSQGNHRSLAEGRTLFPKDTTAHWPAKLRPLQCASCVAL